MSAEPITFGSVCSGIEAASVAWAPLGWHAAWLAEIEPFPCAVLAHHYPEVPNLGDMTTIVRRILSGEVAAPPVFTGGTPCQAFSVAGQRQSLDDARGNLTLTFCEIADAIDHVRAARGLEPCVIKWENVPGVLSTDDNAFGCFLGALAGSGGALLPPDARNGKPARWSNAGCVYGPRRAVAWRILDAQYFGLAQRRRRVFVVASARDGFDPAAVLFEREGVRRDAAPRREAGKDTAGSTGDGLARCLTTGEAKRQDWETCTMLAHTLRVPSNGAAWRGDGADNLVPVAFDTTQVTSATNRSNPQPGDPCHPLAAGAKAPAIAFGGQMSVPQVDIELSQTLQAINPQAVATGMAVRRLMPTECERLQGFPDGYTEVATTMVTHRRSCPDSGTKEVVPHGTDRLPCGCKARHKPADACPDGPRYKALGNSWAVPCARWIGERVARELAK